MPRWSGDAPACSSVSEIAGQNSSLEKQFIETCWFAPVCIRSASAMRRASVRLTKLMLYRSRLLIVCCLTDGCQHALPNQVSVNTNCVIQVDSILLPGIRSGHSIRRIHVMTNPNDSFSQVPQQ